MKEINNQRTVGWNRRSISDSVYTVSMIFFFVQMCNSFCKNHRGRLAQAWKITSASRVEMLRSFFTSAAGVFSFASLPVTISSRFPRALSACRNVETPRVSIYFQHGGQMDSSPRTQNVHLREKGIGKFPVYNVVPSTSFLTIL